MRELQEALAQFSPQALDLAANEIQSTAEWGDKVRHDEMPGLSDEDILRLEGEIEQAMVAVAIQVRYIAEQARAENR
jgi:hypothetical protein